MIRVLFDDLLKQDVDAIVNPANRFMLHGGGLAGIIAAKAGPEIVRETQALAPIPTGEGLLTGAGQFLPQKAIIHVVGPVYDEAQHTAYWRNNASEKPQEELLANAYKNAVGIAAQHELTSIALPAISCGVFHYPVREAAPIAIAALREAQRAYPEVEDIRICVLDDSHYKAFTEALALDA